MDIDRLWGQAPGWSASMPREEMEMMLAWYEVHRDPNGTAGQKRTVPNRVRR